MKDKRLHVGLGYKVNMGNYETLDINYSLEGTLEEGETLEATFAKMYGWVNEKVGQEMAKARAASRVNNTPRRAGS